VGTPHLGLGERLRRVCQTAIHCLARVKTLIVQTVGPVLKTVLSKVTEVDLHPDKFNNVEMGYP